MIGPEGGYEWPLMVQPWWEIESQDARLHPRRCFLVSKALGDRPRDRANIHIPALDYSRLKWIGSHRFARSNEKSVQSRLSTEAVVFNLGCHCPVRNPCIGTHDETPHRPAPQPAARQGRWMASMPPCQPTRTAERRWSEARRLPWSQVRQ